MPLTPSLLHPSFRFHLQNTCSKTKLLQNFLMTVQSTQPSMMPFWAWGSVWPHGSHTHEAGPADNTDIEIGESMKGSLQKCNLIEKTIVIFLWPKSKFSRVHHNSIWIPEYSTNWGGNGKKWHMTQRPSSSYLLQCNIPPKISGLTPSYWSLSHHVEGHLSRRNSLLVLLHDPEIKFHCVRAIHRCVYRCVCCVWGVCVCVHKEREREREEFGQSLAETFFHPLWHWRVSLGGIQLPQNWIQTPGSFHVGAPAEQPGCFHGGQGSKSKRSKRQQVETASFLRPGLEHWHSIMFSVLYWLEWSLSLPRLRRGNIDPPLDGRRSGSLLNLPLVPYQRSFLHVWWKTLTFIAVNGSLEFFQICFPGKSLELRDSTDLSVSGGLVSLSVSIYVFHCISYI